MVGIVAGFVSTAWNFAYTRTSNKMQKYLDALPGQAVEKVKKQQVISLITRGVFINLLGLGSTLIGVQALVGLLVAKTLTNATVNPTLGGYNPVLALDVFLVQAATNTLLGHFLSMCISLLLLNVVGEGRGLQFQVGGWLGGRAGALLCATRACASMEIHVRLEHQRVSRCPFGRHTGRQRHHTR